MLKLSNFKVKRLKIRISALVQQLTLLGICNSLISSEPCLTLVNFSILLGDAYERDGSNHGALRLVNPSPSMPHSPVLSLFPA